MYLIALKFYKHGYIGSKSVLIEERLIKSGQCLCSKVEFGFWMHLVIFWDSHNIVSSIQWAPVCCQWRQLKSWSVSWQLSSCYVSCWQQRYVWVLFSIRWLSGYTLVSCSGGPRFDSWPCWSLQASAVIISSLFPVKCYNGYSAIFYSAGSNIRTALTHCFSMICALETPATRQPLYGVFCSFVSILHLLVEIFMYYSQGIFLLASHGGSLTSHYWPVRLPLTTCST
jgi:hypothetical protein